MKHRIIVVNLLLILGLQLASCSQGSITANKVSSKQNNKQVHKSLKHIHYISKSSRDPFLQISMPVKNPSPLTSYPLKDLQLLGIIMSHNKAWALLKTPDGKIYPIHKGDVIGSSLARVIALNFQEIIVRQHLGKQSHEINLALLTN